MKKRVGDKLLPLELDTCTPAPAMLSQWAAKKLIPPLAHNRHLLHIVSCALPVGHFYTPRVSTRLVSGSRSPTNRPENTTLGYKETRTILCAQYTTSI